eukprot:scaffold36531_cov128-Isochrysis_galbana.AAC.4
MTAAVPRLCSSVSRSALVPSSPSSRRTTKRRRALACLGLCCGEGRAVGELGSCAARPAAADGTRQGRCCSCGQYWLGYAGHGWPEALVAASARAVPDELGGKAVQCPPPPLRVAGLFGACLMNYVAWPCAGHRGGMVSGELGSGRRAGRGADLQGGRDLKIAAAQKHLDLFYILQAHGSQLSRLSQQPRLHH